MVEACEACRIEPFIAVKRDEHHPAPQERFTEPAALPADATPAQTMAHKLKTKAGRALYGRYDAIDGYTAPTRAAKLLAGLGFSEQQQQNNVRSFSGGWRMRLNPAQALMCRSDLLLLDEPTNHLDLDAILWLEDWLNRYTGTLVLISHDRDFLDATVDHILHIEQQKMTLYTSTPPSALGCRNAT